MALPILRLSKLLALSPPDRLALLERAAREINLEIEHLKSGPMRVGYGRSRHSRNYHLQSLYARRQQLVALAREAGCDGWEPKLLEAA